METEDRARELFLSNLGEKVRKKRLKNRWSVIQLAEEAEMTPPTIYNLENGKSVTMITLLRVCKAFGCQPTDFIPVLT